MISFFNGLFGFKNASSQAIERLLEKEDVTLENLFDEEEFSQDVRLSLMNNKVVEFLSNKDKLTKLLKYATEEPPEDADHNRGYKYPFIASEIFSCEVGQLMDQFFAEEEAEKVSNISNLSDSIEEDDNQQQEVEGEEGEGKRPSYDDEEDADVQIIDSDEDGEKKDEEKEQGSREEKYRVEEEEEETREKDEEPEITKEENEILETGKKEETEETETEEKEKEEKEEPKETQEKESGSKEEATVEEVKVKEKAEKDEVEKVEKEETKEVEVIEETKTDKKEEVQEEKPKEEPEVKNTEETEEESEVKLETQNEEEKNKTLEEKKEEKIEEKVEEIINDVIADVTAELEGKETETKKEELETDEVQINAEEVMQQTSPEKGEGEVIENTEEEEEKKELKKDELLISLFSMLEADKINIVMAGYFAKVVSALISTKTKEIYQYVYENDNILDNLLKHNYSKSISELLVKFLTQEDVFEGENVPRNSAIRLRILSKLIDYMGSNCEMEENINACITICEVINSKSSLLSFLGSENILQKLFDIALTGQSYPLRCALKTFIMLLSHKYPKKKEFAFNLGIKEDDSEVQTEETEVAESPEEQSAMSKAICHNLSDIMNLLKKESREDFKTSYGQTIIPVGMLKIRIVEFIQSALKINDSFINNAMDENGVPSYLLEMYNMYPMNSVLHFIIHQIFSEAMESENNEVKFAFVIKSDLPQFLINAAKEKDKITYKDTGRSIRLGFMGYVTKLGNQLVQAANSDSTSEITNYLQEVGEWNEFLEEYLSPTTQKEKKELGAKEEEPVIPMDPRDVMNKDDDDDFNFDYDYREHDEDNEPFETSEKMLEESAQTHINMHFESTSKRKGRYDEDEEGEEEEDEVDNTPEIVVKFKGEEEDDIEEEVAPPVEEPERKLSIEDMEQVKKAADEKEEKEKEEFSQVGDNIYWKNVSQDFDLDDLLKEYN